MQPKLHHTVNKNNTDQGIHQMVHVCCNLVMDIAERRRARLRQLIEERSLTAVANMLGKQPNQLSDTAAGRKSFGEKVARSMEEKAGLPKGWFDDEDTSFVITNTPQSDHVQIPVMNAVASMGLGRPMPETESVVDVIKLTKTWVHENLRSITNARNLAALSAFGDSMAPTFTDGDILLVDRGVTTIELDAVYVIGLKGNLFIKRVQRRITDEAIIIKSDNKNYDPEILTNSDRENLHVLGRVVWAWNGRKL
ncbi:MAG: S24 family peptidase [Rhodocyclaceae bacterium]